MAIGVEKIERFPLASVLPPLFYALGSKMLYGGSEAITRNREGIVGVFGMRFGAAVLVQGETKSQTVKR